MYALPSFLFLLLISLPPPASTQPCGQSCRFRLCQATGGELGESGRAVLQRGPFVAPQGPVICRARQKLGFVLETAEALVVVPGRPRTPISAFTPGPLDRPFSPRFFAVRRVPALGKSAVVKAKSRGAQQRVLDGLCIRLPIRKYERLFMKGAVRRVVKTRGSPNDCVAFRARVPMLLVELSWVGGDDLELAVITPRGDLLSKFSERDEHGGRFLSDSVAKCGEKMPVGKEIVRYWREGDIASGTYQVQLRHFENCGEGPTKWTLRVTVDDKVRVMQTGRTDADKDALFRELIFVI